MYSITYKTVLCIARYFALREEKIKTNRLKQGGGFYNLWTFKLKKGC